MNTQTENAIQKLQQLIPVSAVIHKSTIDYGIDALLAGVEREQVQEKRIIMLEQRLKERNMPETPHKPSGDDLVLRDG